MRPINKIIVHCAATKPSMDIGKAEIDRWHRKKGWLKIGYHIVIRRDGTIENGRELTIPGAHVRGHNKDSIGICLIGGMSEDGEDETNFTEEQWSSLFYVVTGLKQQFPTASVLGHNDFTSRKTCPTFDVPSWWRRVNS